MHRPSNVATATRKKSSIGWVLLACSVAGCKGIDTTEFILGRAGAFELAVRAAQHRHRYLTMPVAAQRSGNQRDPEASEDSKAGLRSPSMMCSCIAIAARGVVA